MLLERERSHSAEKEDPVFHPVILTEPNKLTKKKHIKNKKPLLSNVFVPDRNITDSVLKLQAQLALIDTVID